jgi:hypothetical protein
MKLKEFLRMLLEYPYSNARQWISLQGTLLAVCPYDDVMGYVGRAEKGDSR